MEASPRNDLQGLKVVSFESRRAKEMAELIRRYGGEPIVAPSMREIPLSENHRALELLPKIEAGEVEILILMTGVGTKTLNEILLTRYPQEKIVTALKSVQLVARGPKPVGALKELGLQAAVTVPEPNTWREVVLTLESAIAMPGKRVAIQEYGIANPELVGALERAGATVTTIPIYRWALPADVTPLQAAMEKIIGGQADILLFTNGAQVEHLIKIAESNNSSERLRAAIKNVVIGSVGPVCSEVLRQFGIQPDIEPVHPKMGSLIAEVAARARSVLCTKQTF